MSASTGTTSIIPRVSRVEGRVRVPGDKSVSHRYAMFAAIADGTSSFEGYAPGADCAATLACLEALGVRVERGPRLTIHGAGLGGLRQSSHALDAANSGTSMRLLSGLLAAHPFTTVIGGDASLSQRPMRRVIE
ncbi:MAG: 3-phosphoshikimate 1-carboxyvinyltransferase, partial [Gemmatimonadales bacterium]